MQVAASPCWELALPDVISASSSPDAGTHTATGCGSASTRFFLPQQRPSLRDNRSAYPQCSAQRLQSGKVYAVAVIPVMFQPPGLLATPVAPTAAVLAAGQPWRFRSSRTCVVAFARIEYASRPNRATDGRGLTPHKTRGLVGRSYPSAFPVPLSSPSASTGVDTRAGEFANAAADSHANAAVGARGRGQRHALREGTRNDRQDRTRLQHMKAPRRIT